MEGHDIPLDTYRDDLKHSCGFCAEDWYNSKSICRGAIQWQSISPPAHDGMETRTACNASSTKEHHILLLLVCSLQAQLPSSQVCHKVKQLRCWCFSSVCHQVKQPRCLNFNSVFEPGVQSGHPQENNGMKATSCMPACFPVVRIACYMCRHCSLCVHAVSTMCACIVHYDADGNPNKP